MRNLRIRQLILLILRTLIILFLVLAFARPTVRSSSGSLLAERTPIEAFIILDNSLSLNEIQMSGSLVREMRHAFEELETVFQNGDRLSVINATIPVQELIKKENYQTNIWERVNQKLQPNYLKTDLSGAIQLALKELRESPYTNREIFILSDFQKSGLDLDYLKIANEDASLNNMKVFTIPIAHHNFENISVDSVEVVNRLIEKNQPIQLKAYLSNHHPEKFLNTMVSVLINGKRVAQKNVSLKPGLISETDFQLTLTENGFIDGVIEIESDAIVEDNRRYFSFYVPKKIRILHIVQNSDFYSYIPLINQPAQKRGIFEQTVDIALNWTDFNLNDFEIVVLEGLNDIPINMLQRLSRFVEEGGGLIILPDENIATPSYRRVFQEFNIGSILELKGTTSSREQFLTLDNFQWNHPIFEGLFTGDQKKPNPIEVYSAFQIKPKSLSNVLINMSDKTPFLILSNTGKGTCITFASALQPRWTQLPLKGFIVPLLYRIIYYSGTRKVFDRQTILCGKSYNQLFSNLEPPFDFQLEGSGDNTFKLNPVFKGSDVFLQVEQILEPGNFKVKKVEQTLNIFSVNHWIEESDMTFYDENEIREHLSETIYITDFEKISENIIQSRFGREFWTHFLLIAFVLLLIEMIVARTASKKEFSETRAQEPALKI
jgi:hypothetical protein